MSPPTVSKARTNFPIFAASWATNRPDFLVVGGGGGPGKHGVQNSIALFDFSSRAANIDKPSVEIEASKDDSVACLANLATKDGLILFAGINSSEETRSRGRNEHMRSFQVRYQTSKIIGEWMHNQDGKIEFLSKVMLFSPPQSAIGAKEGYQRIVKLSPLPRTASNTPSRRIGAIASSLAGDNEVIIFSAISNRPEGKDIIRRCALPKGQEANDLDIFALDKSRFQVAWVLDQEVFVQDISDDLDQMKSKEENESRKLYTVPHPDLGEREPRSKLRCIRWLSPKHLLLLANKPNRTGVELLILHLYEDSPANIIMRKTLPKHVKAATDMDVALLDPDSDGAYQIVIAIGAIDISLSVYTMDYSRDSLSRIHQFNTYHNVHDVQMTRVVFAPFYKAESQVPRPQYLRLASTSLGNTISVESFELQATGSRHVLETAQSRNLYRAATYLAGAMVVAVLAILIQSLLDPEGRSILPSSLQKSASHDKTFGESLRDKGHEAILNNADSPVIKTSQRIADLLHLHLPHVLSHSVDHSLPDSQKALIIRHDAATDNALSTEVHDDHEAVLKQHAEAKKWDDLSQEEQKLWKTKLQDAGMWAVGEGETILKSIFFGQIGGFVGQVAEGVLG